MTKGGYVIVKKKGKVSEVFASKAKERRFARENRLGHRSEYRKPHVCSTSNNCRDDAVPRTAEKCQELTSRASG